MMRAVLVVGCMLSLYWLPWFLTAMLVLGSALFVPLLPLGIGMLADATYAAPHTVPLYTLLGLLTSGGVFFVRSQLRTSIIGE